MTLRGRRRDRGTRALIAVIAIGLTVSLLVGSLPSAGTVARADAPAVALSLAPTDNPVATQLGLTADTPLPAASIASIDFEYAPADSGDWTSIGMNPTAPNSLPPYVVQFDTSSVNDGLYDLRAVLTDTHGNRSISAIVRDRLVANASPVVTLDEPGATLATGSPLRGTVALHSDPTGAGSGAHVATISFELSLADHDLWSTIATPVNETRTPANPGGANVAFSTRTVADGVYDLRAVPRDDAGASYAAIPVRGVIVDNTPPTVTLVNPGSPVSGATTLAVQASDAGSGVASVEFERAAGGTGVWKRIGMTTRAPFAHSFDTTSWADGSYDLRAIATDRAGNVTISNVVSTVSSNPPSPATPVPAIQGVAVPAHNITMLGSVGGSPTHEAWAYGYTSAPPASVGGTPLPYTAPGDQFVLLRYDDNSGWQIADVLRSADGSAFKLAPPGDAGPDAVHASGVMTPSGEAWLWISEASRRGGTSAGELFHRAPGRRFLLDAGATQAVGPALLANLAPDGRLRLRQASDGSVYGVLTSPAQPPQQGSAPGAGANSVPIDEALRFAVLQNGVWTPRTAALPDSYSARPGDDVTLRVADVDAPGAGWGALRVENPPGTSVPTGLLLGRFHGDNWTYAPTGLDALDLTGSVANPKGTAVPTGLAVDGTGVWIGATVTLPAAGDTTAPGLPVVARYDAATGRVTNSWCSLPVANSCDEALDANHPAAVPDAIFPTPSGTVALALADNSLRAFARGQWSAISAPGYSPQHGDTFSGPTDGWLGSQSAVGQVSAQASTSLLAPWPISVRSPLTSVALPPETAAGLGESGALAVGLGGTALAYDASAGWVVAPTPPRAHHINLTSVAFNGPTTAFAVGQFGLIIHWDGSAWSEDPASIALTQSQLNAVAFAPSGEGWAVGADGTILHWDGTSWSTEQPPSDDAGTNITSVAVSGSTVFAIANGNLIERQAGGTWVPADPSLLPAAPAPVPGDMRLVAGLPDGGAVIAGRSLVLVRQNAGAAFQFSDQPLEGIAVGLAAFRDGAAVRAAVSLAPPAASPLPPFGPTNDIGGFPAGDGELLIESAGGWQDLSRAQPAGTAGNLPADGAVKPDPVLAVATSPDGQHAWAVGGYAGTPSASGQGTASILPARPAGWQTASLWRYDAGGSAAAPTLSPDTPDIPASPGTLSFAFFSSPTCRVECAATVDAQPDTNLTGALSQISAYAAQPGGPLFAMLGGNARGPLDSSAFGAGNGAFDFTRLPDLLAGLTVPLFAAYGPLDAVPTANDPTQPWSDAFAGAPAPLGNGGAAPGITPVASTAPAGAVSRYYVFDASQNDATVRVIVLDNSKGSLEASAVGETAWLQAQLNAANIAGVPVVAVAAQPLTGTATHDGPSVATMLANAGVLAVFTGGGASQLNQHHDVPENGPVTIPEYEGATLGYQQPKNNGVVWYDVSVDTTTNQVSVNAIPVIESLSLDPLGGLHVARSLTLQFQAIGRRPTGSLATAPIHDDKFPGFDSYVEIPAPSCGALPCITPTYAFRSSNPAIGNFVVPSGPGSPVPKLDGNGHTTASQRSGLFCAFNAGTTTVSVTAGLLTYSQTVTVAPGGFGAPCGTVALPAAPVAATHRGAGAAATPAAATPPPPPAAATAAPAPLIKLAPAPPAPHPAPVVKPAPQVQAAPAPSLPAAPLPVLLPIPSVVPPATPAQPIPPGGATAPSAASAPRREKARKHASQSAFTTLSPRTRGVSWYYGSVGVAAIVALMLTAQGLRPRRRTRPAYSSRRTGGR